MPVSVTNLQSLVRYIGCFTFQLTDVWTHAPYIVQTTKALVLESDLILLLGRALVPRQSDWLERTFKIHRSRIMALTAELPSRSCIVASIVFLIGIVKRLTLNANAPITISVRRSWLQVLQDLQALELVAKTEEVEEFEEAIQMWRECGQTLGLEEDALVKERTDLQRSETDGSIGCSWMRCPLHLRDDIPSSRQMRRCSGCKAVRDFRRVDTECWLTCFELLGAVLHVALSTAVSTERPGIGDDGLRVP